MNGKNKRQNQKTSKRRNVKTTAKKKTATDTPLNPPLVRGEAETRQCPPLVRGEAVASPRPQSTDDNDTRTTPADTHGVLAPPPVAPEPPVAAKNDKNGLSLRKIVVPTATLKEGYVQRTINIGSLTNEQAIAMCSLRMGLNAQIPPARLKPRMEGDPGKIVDVPIDAIRWLLERVADEMGLYDE